jgi:hypothetical protein
MIGPNHLVWTWSIPQPLPGDRSPPAARPQPARSLWNLPKY